MSRNSRDVWTAWIPALIWLGIIAIESTDLLSGSHTVGVLYPVFHFLFGLSPEQFEPLHFLIRKTGHVVGYGVLSLLLFRAWRVTVLVTGNPKWCFAWAVPAFFTTALVAGLDEWHQNFIPSRTGSVHDALLDSAAALAAQTLIFMWMRVRLYPAADCS